MVEIRAAEREVAEVVQTRNRVKALFQVGLGAVLMFKAALAIAATGQPEWARFSDEYHKPSRARFSEIYSDIDYIYQHTPGLRKGFTLEVSESCYRAKENEYSREEVSRHLLEKSFGTVSSMNACWDEFPELESWMKEGLRRIRHQKLRCTDEMDPQKTIAQAREGRTPRRGRVIEFHPKRFMHAHGQFHEKYEGMDTIDLFHENLHFTSVDNMSSQTHSDLQTGSDPSSSDGLEGFKMLEHWQVMGWIRKWDNKEKGGKEETKDLTHEEKWGWWASQYSPYENPKEQGEKFQSHPKEVMERDLMKDFVKKIECPRTGRKKHRFSEASDGLKRPGDHRPTAFHDRVLGLNHVCSGFRETRELGWAAYYALIQECGIGECLSIFTQDGYDAKVEGLSRSQAWKLCQRFEKKGQAVFQKRGLEDHLKKLEEAN